MLLFAVCGAVPTDLCYNHSRIKTNQEMDIVTVDRQKVLDAFAAYIRPYDAQDPKVSLKIHHTYRVAALCEQIGRSIALEGTALDLAWLCGMLHDVGRFEQLRRFGTFDDSKSIDHARAGVQVLFEQGHIRDYLDDDSEDAMLRTAVEWHSAYRLPDGLAVENLVQNLDFLKNFYLYIKGLLFWVLFCGILYVVFLRPVERARFLTGSGEYRDPWIPSTTY